MNNRDSKAWWNQPRIAASLFLAMPLALIGQDNQDDEDAFSGLEELEVVSVTGTRLTGAAVEGSLPISTISQEQLSLSPATTPVEYLRDLPAVGGPSTQSSNFTNGTDGASRVGLRTLTGGNTLILFNGRRITPSGTGATPNLNLLPALNAIKRIEIIKAGGSTVYGTSAVAGVINFILDDDFEGLEVNLGYGNTTDTDVHEATVDFVMGGKGAGDKLSFVVGGRYREEGSLMAPDRPWMLGGGTSSLPNPGRFWFYTAVEDMIMDTNGYSAEEYTGSWTLRPGVDVADGPEDFIPWVNENPYDQDSLGRNGNRFPYENYTIAVNPNKQHSIFAVADYQINDKVKFYTELSYAYSELEFRLAPAPTDFWIPGSNYWMREIFGDAAVDASEIEDGYGDAAYAYYRFVELGARINEIQFRGVRLVGGVEVEINDDWSIDAYYLYSEEKKDDRELNGGYESQVSDLLALGTSDAYNFFAASYVYGTELGSGSVNPADPNYDLANQVRADNETDTLSRTELVDVKVIGEAVELPAGPLQIVAGAEWRRQYVKEKPDALKLSGSLGWNAADGVTVGGREVYGIYGEVGVPITSTDFVLGSIDVAVSGRYEDYKDEFETDVFGGRVRWQPIADVTMRASFSQAFYAPDLIDLYNPGFGSFPELSDPFYSADDARRLYQVETFYVGSQVTGVSLQPEESDVYSVGLTYSPSQIEGLDLTVDWWRIETTNLIVYSVQGLLTEFRQSYTGGDNGSMTHPSASNPYLSTNGGPIVYDENSDEPVQQILGAGPRNVAGANTEGLDAELNYRFETDTMGTFFLNAQITYYITQEQQSSTTFQWFSFNGEYDGDVAYPRFKGQMQLIWDFADFTTALTWNHTGNSQDINIDPADPGGYKTHVEAHNEIDIAVEWRVPFLNRGLASTTITAGVENIFDEMPPIMYTAFSNNYPERNYDPRGRSWFVSLKQRF